MTKNIEKVIAFDLDYTLWPFWVDAHISGGPFKVNKQGNVVDCAGFVVKFYKDVPSIILFLHHYYPGIKLAIASRTPEPKWARSILELIKLEANPDIMDKLINTFNLEKNDTILTQPIPLLDLFKSVQLYPGNKLPHFKQIQKDTEIGYSNMMFYDDEPRNIRDVSSLGVKSIFVKDGLTLDLFIKSFKEFIE